MFRKMRLRLDGFTTERKNRKRLKVLRLLALPLYIELHDILYLLDLSKERYDVSLTNYIQTVASENTKQSANQD